MYLLNLLRKYKKDFFSNPQNHLLRVEINSEKLSDNLKFIKEKFPSHKIGAVLKSNAYGHGLKEVGLFLDSRNEVDWLIVDSIIEARTLRDNGVEKKILILGYIPFSIIPSLKKIKNSALTINSLKQAEFVSKTVNFKLPVHIKVDTGMYRQGIGAHELERVIKILSENKKIILEGLATHLADADNQEDFSTLEQLKNWQEVVDVYKKYENEGLFHFSATAGSVFSKKAEGNMLRIGLGMYGFDNTKDKILRVSPVLSLWTKLVNKREIKKGEGVGYNFTWKAEKDTVVGIIPCGYYEGIPRCLSNKGWVYYKNIPIRIIGTVSMNLTAIDITEIKNDIDLEDEIEVFSDDSDKLNSIRKASDECKTIPYEILVRLAPTIKRVIKSKSKKLPRL